MRLFVLAVVFSLAACPDEPAAPAASTPAAAATPTPTPTPTPAANSGW